MITREPTPTNACSKTRQMWWKAPKLCSLELRAVWPPAASTTVSWDSETWCNQHIEWLASFDRRLLSHGNSGHVAKPKAEAKEKIPPQPQLWLLWESAKNACNTYNSITASKESITTLSNFGTRSQVCLAKPKP